MRIPFLEDSRVVVVLYGQPWGKTPWTRVEQTAIQEGCLDHGWERLFFIMLDNSAPPVWLPQTHVRFNFSDFGLEQAVGAIKARVQERGGAVSPLTAVKSAALYDQEDLYIQDKRRLNSYEGVQIIKQNLIEIFAELERLCNEIQQTKNRGIRAGSNQGHCVITNGRISLLGGWQWGKYANSTEGAAFKIREYNGQLALPNERMMFRFDPDPTVLNETSFLPELSRAREYGWIEEGQPSEFLSSAALADRCVRQFFDLATRDSRGEIEHPFA